MSVEVNISLLCAYSCISLFKWVYNILDGKKEQELILYKDENPETGFVLLKDIKWDGETLEQLYYQVIINRRDIKSIR